MRSPGYPIQKTPLCLGSGIKESSAVTAAGSEGLALPRATSASSSSFRVKVPAMSATNLSTTATLYPFRHNPEDSWGKL